jgi:YfiR/HmsC-like
MNPNLNYYRVPAWAGAFLVFLLMSIAATSSAIAQSEDGIKAAFLYNFAKFTEWPSQAFASANAPLTVGFVGADNMADMFEQNVTGKNANGRDFAVKKLDGAGEAQTCQIVFVGDASQAVNIIKATKGKPVLTVGSSDSFAAAGGMINFIKDGSKITFDLDLGAAGVAGLNVDPKLRQFARDVKGG